MSVANPASLEMYWINGQPYQFIENYRAFPNTTVFWVNGDSVSGLQPTPLQVSTFFMVFN